MNPILKLAHAGGSHLEHFCTYSNQHYPETLIRHFYTKTKPLKQFLVIQKNKKHIDILTIESETFSEGARVAECIFEA
ncbi:hypothetical protein [Pseudoalteromonas spongiae]|uniref:hypothetical protein n=1 Tax=Pseudoalteromonas spongiae TaxID=298657 RepID=UPI000C2D1089|nr:hypothetical protein [Pseudoalteromonas spongiae]